MKNYTASEVTYYIAYNNNGIVHYGKLAINQEVSTGQPFLETFQDEALWENKLLELGITQNELNNYKTEY